MVELTTAELEQIKARIPELEGDELREALRRVTAQFMAKFCLTWTTEKPTVSGWYWFSRPLMIVRVDVESDGVRSTGIHWSLSHFPTRRVGRPYS